VLAQRSSNTIGSLARHMYHPQIQSEATVDVFARKYEHKKKQYHV
jgi:hypothetical protein